MAAELGEGMSDDELILMIREANGYDGMRVNREQFATVLTKATNN